jgi:hypothetical protein
VALSTVDHAAAERFDLGARVPHDFGADLRAGQGPSGAHRYRSSSSSSSSFISFTCLCCLFSAQVSIFTFRSLRRRSIASSHRLRARIYSTDSSLVGWWASKRACERLSPFAHRRPVRVLVLMRGPSFFLFRLEYITHFLKACTRVMGLETSSSRVFVDDKRTTALDVFPACIDPSKLQGVLKTPAVRSVPVSL